MTPENIEAIGHYIVIPICVMVCVVVGIVAWLYFLLRGDND
jgi:hypothetical protein